MFYSYLGGDGHKVLKKVFPSPKDKAIEKGNSDFPTKRWSPFLRGMEAL
jgi:hypothetical protein